MRLTDLLTPERVAIRHHDRAHPLDKAALLHAVAEILANGTGADVTEVERVLVERERLQSTGIGEGVAIPHGALAQLDTQHACLVVIPEGLDFTAIDGLPVNIVFAVIGPKRATGEHLKTLARVSRLLRNRAFRDHVLAAPNAKAAYALVAAAEEEERR